MGLLERIQANNARFPAAEAEKYAVLAACEALLAEYRACPAPPDDLTYATIRMLRYQRRYAEALELMQQRRPMLADKEREVAFYELELHFLCGDRAGGDRLLARFEGAGKMRPSWQRAIHKMRHRFEAEAAWGELARLERALGDREASLAAADLEHFRKVLPEANQALEVFCFLRDRLARLDALPAGGPGRGLAVFSRYHGARLIACAGFGWSGSGAVACFLSQHAQVSAPFGMAELGYLQGRGDREGFFSFLRPGAIDGNAMKRLLARFLVESIACLRDFKQSYSMLMLRSAAQEGRVAVLAALLDDFHASMLAADALQGAQVRKKIVGAFVQRLLSIGGGSHVLLNNVFLASKLDLVETMDDTRFVAVERDARDQYVARRFESGDFGHQRLAEFASVLAQTRAAFGRVRQSVPAETLQQRLRLIRFEDFLRDEAVRRDLLAWLGLSPDGIVPDPGKFDLAVSAGNIGIHQGRLDPGELALAERELGTYLASCE